MNPGIKVDLVVPAAVPDLPHSLVFPLFEQETLESTPWAADALRADVRDAVSRRELRGRLGELYFTRGGSPAQRVIVVGLGPRDKESPEKWRRAAAAAALAARGRGLARLALVAPASSVAARQAMVEGIQLATLDADTYRTSPRDAMSLSEVVIAAEGNVDATRAALERGRILGIATNTARALANEPANLLSPLQLASRAAAIAGAAGLRVEVLAGGALSARSMGLLLGVGRGSAEAPCLVDIRYDPEEAGDGPVLGLVGKGVTFDTGGISIKAADGMEKMKYDMAGAAAVLGAMEAIAALRPPVRVRGIVAAAENMPGGRAIRPGDVLRSASGRTVEVNNTDAEGRLILGDALWYAREEAGATHLVDVATLTGACVVALGRHASGLFAANQAWGDLVREVADASGDRVWPMPLHEDYAEQLKSDIADVANTGGRAGGAITAAMFLEPFAGGMPWAHLDVAGTAWLDESKPWMPKGATGVMTRTLAGLALAHARIARP